MQDTRWLVSILFLFNSIWGSAQLKWVKVDSLYGHLPNSVHVYRTVDPLGDKPNIAFYLEVALDDRHIDVMADTSHKRRLKPSGFYEKNKNPLVVVNTTFFSFASNQNLNVVIRKGKLLGYNVHTIAGRGKDTLTYRHPIVGAFGISRKRKADIAWVYTDSSLRFPYELRNPVPAQKDSNKSYSIGSLRQYLYLDKSPTPMLDYRLLKWKMKTAVGGGPVLLQNGQIMITNNQELKFAGKAINDKHPRTAIGYTPDNRMIILAVEGRNNGVAEGATLVQLAEIFRDLGCYEALNLDGGGSSCLLINGKETIKPSDKEGQRPIPAVLIVKTL
jgi:hypothetical protein